MLKGLALAGACLLNLAGCATPRERIVTKEVRVPVAVVCAPTLPAKPSYAADGVSLDASLYDLVRALLIDREQRREREAITEAALKGCSS